MQSYDLIIIGGGASGMMAAAECAMSGRKVALIEKNPQCGQKLLLTGKGRCNITNMSVWEEFCRHIHPDSSFFKNAFYHFSNEDMQQFLFSTGLRTVMERGRRLYPAEGRSRDVRDAICRFLTEHTSVQVISSCEVFALNRKDDGSFVLSVRSSTSRIDSVKLSASAVILATGGLSYPVTGSTGDGYRFAEHLGHRIVHTHPSLTALKPDRPISELVGLTLKNVGLSLIVDRETVQNEFGELSFTDGGIEGALGFRVSRKAVKALESGSKVELSLDLKPALSTDQIRRRLEREFRPDLPLLKIVESFLPIQAASPFLELSENVSYQNLPLKLKDWRFHIIGNVGYERCVVTAGGVDLKEISRKTMESKIVPGLFFAGEVMNLDADTGGYNLQVAFSTGVLAASSAMKYLDKISI